MIIMMPLPNNLINHSDDAVAASAVPGTFHPDYAIGDGEEVFVLPPGFVPGKWDVICQRGKECFEHGKL